MVFLIGETNKNNTSKTKFLIPHKSDEVFLIGETKTYAKADRKSQADAFLSTHKIQAAAGNSSFLRNSKPFNSFLRNFLGNFAPFLHNSY